MPVYLLHFAEPIGEPQSAEQRAANGLPRRKRPYRPHVRHYIGYANRLAARLDQHKRRPDARLLQVAKEQGIGFALARTWRGDKALEKRIKSWKMAPRLCPICQGEKTYQECEW